MFSEIIGCDIAQMYMMQNAVTADRLYLLIDFN